MKYEIKELEVGGLLDQTIRLLRDHFGFLVAIVCMVLLPIQILLGLVQVSLMPQIDPATMQDPAVQAQAAGNWLVFMGATLLGLPIFFLLNAVVQSSIAYGIAHRYLGTNVTVGQSIRAALRRWLALLGVSLLYGAAVGFGMMACLVPGILLMLTWYVLYPVLLFEGKPAMQVFGRSHKLMSGHMGKAFVLAFLIGVLAFVAGVALNFVPNAYVQSIVGSVINAFFVAVNSVAATVVYFSARCRVEQFDLELLAHLVESKQEVQDSTL